METPLKKYLWQFFGYYLVGYLIGMTLLFTVAYFLHLRMPDLILIVILCMLVPQTLTEDFIKNEKRFFTDTELAFMIKRSSLISFVINYALSFLFLLSCLILKLAHIPSPVSNPLVTDFLGFSAGYLLLIFLGSGLLYYFISRLLIGLSFKRRRTT